MEKNEGQISTINKALEMLDQVFDVDRIWWDRRILRK
jgi:hypothetical protein